MPNPPFGAPPPMEITPPEEVRARLERLRAYEEGYNRAGLFGVHKLNPKAFGEWLERLPESKNVEDRRNDPPIEPWPLSGEIGLGGVPELIRPPPDLAAIEERAKKYFPQQEEEVPLPRARPKQPLEEEVAQTAKRLTRAQQEQVDRAIADVAKAFSGYGRK